MKKKLKKLKKIKKKLKLIIMKKNEKKNLCRNIWNGLLPICIARKKIVLQEVRPNSIAR